MPQNPADTPASNPFAAPKLLPGLVSVTFRPLPPDKIVRLVADAKLTGIEWGGDIHVPHGDVRTAARVRRMTEDAGLDIVSYGSYYRVGVPVTDSAAAASSSKTPVNPPFEAVLDTARALGAPTIRVWAGSKGSRDADNEHWQRVLDDSDRICRLAGAANINVAYEWHGGTLTDTLPTALRLLRGGDPSRPRNLRTLWQPSSTEDTPARAREIQTVAPWLDHVHVFYWPGGKHMPLADGKRQWSAYIDALRASVSRPTRLLLEFVKDGSPEQFRQDAATLREWLQT